jgi:hypothetical protein
MVEDDAIEFALPAQPVVRGGNVDGLVKAPDEEGEGEGGIEAEKKFFHGESRWNFPSVLATHGKTRSGLQEVSGHDFSRAVNATK